ncbi:uncharacterized protein EMH_0097130 [Eimeria mitis]|uniref:Uncharacterized protein n=1 Tax=Eimeria mitis TaxID=44415 RepID=U6KFY4_9EIME|nr:uncharacterized protein EMH_0097130 [Eimeria mitis]CDJ36834.1 hypothetical protein, conserved [Eimeria mitis]
MHVQSVEAQQGTNLVSEGPPITEVVERSASHELKNSGDQRAPSLAQGDTKSSSSGFETSTAPNSEGIHRRERDLTESGATDTNDVKTAGREASARPTSSTRAAAVQKAVAEVFAAQNERRAAALASRISSRTISRAEGSAELKCFEQRSDVAQAAAEQLRRIEAARAASEIQGPKSNTVEPSGGPQSLSRDAYQDVKIGGSQSGHEGAKERVEQIGKPSVQTPPTAPPKDDSPVAHKGEHETTDPSLLQRARLPQNIYAAQHELAAAAEMDEQRRLAAVVSRARSRIVSRADGCADRSNLADRADVARAAAEQLRKMAQASSKQVDPRLRF